MKPALTRTTRMTSLVRVCVVTLFLFDAFVFVTPSSYTTGAIVDMGMVREDDAKLRQEIKSRAVVKEKVAPRNAVTQKVELTMEVSVATIFGTNDANRLLQTGLFLTLSWRDPYLAWNASQYSGVFHIEMPTDAMWTPDLRVLNTFNQKLLLDGFATAILYSSGTAYLSLPMILETTCVMDLKDYPYDQQECGIIFYSFGDILNVTSYIDEYMSEVLNTKLNLGNEWDLVRTEVLSFTMFGENCHFPKLLLTLRRKTTFYTVCLVMPMVVTSYMNTLVFLLPLQAGEKVSFLISIFVSTSVFVSYFTSVMPRGLNDLPNLMKLLVGVIVESLVILIATVIVLRLHHRQQGPDDRRPTTDDDDDDGVVAYLSDVNQHRVDKKAVGENPGDKSLTRDGRRAVKLCFGSGQVGSGQVAPSPGEGGARSATSGRRKWGGAAMAGRLDHAFFAVAFIANSAFLISLFNDLKTMED